MSDYNAYLQYQAQLEQFFAENPDAKVSGNWRRTGSSGKPIAGAFWVNSNGYLYAQAEISPLTHIYEYANDDLREVED